LIVLTHAPALGSRAAARARVGAAAIEASRRARRQPRIGGPYAVASSLVRGLNGLGLPFRLDPSRLPGGAGTIAVLSDLGALEQAIAWKRRDSRRRLLAGPNLVVLPSDARSLMTAPEIDVCVVPCEWVKQLYEADSPELVGRIAIWPAGVDARHWSPPAAPRAGRQRTALVYRKELAGQPNIGDRPLRAALDALEQRGFDVRSLSYGTFDREDYRQALTDADLLVFFSPSESQCLAQLEAWAMDVPTLVWAQGRLEYDGRSYSTSSAPYLSPQTGIQFSDTAALEQLLDRWDDLRLDLAPRQWVLDHMTDTICARAFWELAHPRQRVGEPA
jgi:hypothetical protein